MKERPILFSGPMVKAILDGRKSMTRRIVKAPKWSDPIHAGVDFPCPYGHIGDRLWVRETWGAWPHMGGDFQRETIKYRADGEYQNEHNAWRWRPSIHMPRWASRIMLEITSVEVDWIQNITEEDVLREGIEDMGNGCGAIKLDTAKSYSTLKATFKILWDSINGKKYPWSSNPLVWVIEFRRVK